MSDSQVPEGVSIGELLNRHVNYLLPIDWVKAINSKYSKFFSEAELAFELSELERHFFERSSTPRKRLKEYALPQEPIDEELESIFDELDIQFTRELTDREKEQKIKSSRFALAYCGWLVQQSEYWGDVEALKSDFRDELFKSGVPRQPDLQFESLDTVSQEVSALACETKKLCEKWRIANFTTIEKPVPLQPTILIRELSPSQLRKGLIYYAMPDIYPFAGRGEVVEELEARRAFAEAPHLKDWFAMVSSSSRTKKRIFTLARQFQVQHFWRVLLSRHSPKIGGKKTVLQEMLGESLGVDRDTIKADFRTLRKLSFDLLKCPIELYF